jgi:hypothetical protein
LTAAANAFDAVLTAGLAEKRADSSAFVIGYEMKKPAQAVARAGSYSTFATGVAAGRASSDGH